MAAATVVTSPDSKEKEKEKRHPVLLTDRDPPKLLVHGTCTVRRVFTSAWFTESASSLGCMGEVVLDANYTKRTSASPTLRNAGLDGLILRDG